ncbi:exonuclease subunit SbcD [Mixta intestinalis]|jgi:exonuclease SbcD|uniref:Nuclease SbcCD subunit D n=1 Tax=Mixta intestinalis TaxID=1615494 RepID=A0A6P1PVM8_9GAMM|nr:exonuclease subunit SbcD [Mixta intestinalis]QHM70104.1 Nuclease SbcCD subunit D [Mixta intestinalis]
MRIIHTSDWHLGQFFYTRSRAAEHQAFFHWLIDRVEEHQVDAVIVAGDIFDTGSPPSYARELYNRFVVDLQRTGCQLIVLGGNHDSVATLNETRALLACLNAQVIAAASGDPQEQVLTLTTRQGEPGAILCAIPFLRPRDIMRSQAGQSGKQKQLTLLNAITDYYQQSYHHARALSQQAEQPLPVIATGHLTTVGVSKSDAVRDIYIGTLDAFPAQAFPPADYIALGHIHRPQRIANSEHIRYSGSPLPLSFDELGSEKSVFLVSFAGGKLEQVEALPVPCFQPMQTIRGTLAEIEAQLRPFADLSRAQPVWLDIEITTQEYLHNMQQHIQALTEGLPVEVLLMRRSREQRERALARLQNETLSELKVEEVFERRLEQEEKTDEMQLRRIRHLFSDTLDRLQQGEESQP